MPLKEQLYDPVICSSVPVLILKISDIWRHGRGLSLSASTSCPSQVSAVAGVPGLVVGGTVEVGMVG